MRALVGEVAACFETLEPAREQLSRAVLVLLKAFSRDGIIIQLFSQYRSSQTETAVPDLLGDLDACLVSFFERWLGEHEDAIYDATFLQKALDRHLQEHRRRRGLVANAGTSSCVRTEDPGADDLLHACRTGLGGSSERSAPL